MSELGFRVEGSTAYVVCGGNKKEISKDSLVEIYQMVLSHMSPNRDYTGVTSAKKLLRIIGLECEPDDSEAESADDNPPAAKTALAKKGPASAATQTLPKQGSKVAAPAKRPQTTKPPAKDESEEEDEEEEDDEE